MSSFLKILCIFGLILLFNPCFSNELDYDFSDTYSIPIKLSPLNEISTENFHDYGEIAELEVKNTVKHNGKVIVKAGDKIKAKIEMSISAGMNGFPAEIIIDNYEIPGIRKSQLAGTYTKVGQNRCLIVYPVKLLLTPIPLAGSLTNLIKGGNARIKTSDTFEIYYYPNWK